jgi:hypothetical protein
MPSALAAYSSAQRSGAPSAGSRGGSPRPSGWKRWRTGVATGSFRTNCWPCDRKRQGLTPRLFRRARDRASQRPTIPGASLASRQRPHTS